MTAPFPNTWTCLDQVRVAVLIGAGLLCGAESGAEEPVSAPFGRTQGVSPLAPRMTPAPAMEKAPAAEVLLPAPDTAENSFPGCVVLGNGRVYQGVLTELPQSYRVESTTGVVVIPFTEVRTVADSVEQAYQQIRDSYQRPTANDHLDLGRWCFQNQLFESASLEAQSALVLEPNRTEAIKLLQRAETAIGRDADSAAEATSVYRPKREQAMGVISADAQREFGRHIERLAFNKCGNGKCHGPASLSEFKLNKNVRSDQNLQAFLKFMDLENPELSPLLEKSRSADGPHAGLFQGASGPEQYARLLAWVTRVAEEQGKLSPDRLNKEKNRQPGPYITIRPKSGKDQDSPWESETAPEVHTRMSLDSAPDISLDADSPVQDGHIETVAAESISEDDPARSPKANSRSNSGRRPREAPLRSSMIQKLLADQAPDAFDPEEFNRLMHGDRTGPASPQ